MDPIDQSKQLNKERQDYYRTLKKQSNDRDIEVNRLKDAQAKTLQKKDEAHKNQISSIESHHKTNNAENQKNMKEAIDRKRDQFRKDSEEEKVNFSKMSESERKESRDKLARLNEEYRKTIKAEREHTQRAREIEKTGTNEKIRTISNNKETEVSNYKDRTQEMHAENSERYKADKKKLSETYNHNLNAQKTEDARERQKLKDTTRSQLTELDEVHQSEKAMRNKQMELRNQSVKNSAREEVTRVGEEMTRVNESQRNDAKDETQQRDYQKAREISSIQSDAQRDKQIQKEKYEGIIHQIKNNGSGEGEKDKYELYLERKNSDSEKMNRNLVKGHAKELKTHEEIVKEQRLDDQTKQKIEKIREEQEGHQALDSTRREERLRQDKLRKGFEEKIDIDEKGTAIKELKKDREHKDQITKMTHHFANSLDDINYRNDETKKELKISLGDDKKQFLKEKNEQFLANSRDLKFENDKKLAYNTNEFKKSVQNVSMEKERVENMLESRLDKHRKDSTDKNITQNEIFQEKLKSNEDSMRDLMISRESGLKTEIDNIHGNYSQKITQQEFQNQKKINQLTENYEVKLKNMSKEYNKNMVHKNNEHVNERKTLQAGFESEKKRIVEQYEDKIRTMNKNHEEKISKFKSSLALAGSGQDNG